MTALMDGIGSNKIIDNLKCLKLVDLEKEEESFKNLNKLIENFQVIDAADNSIIISQVLELLKIPNVDIDIVRRICKFLSEIVVHSPKYAQQFNEEQDGILKLINLLDLFKDEIIPDYVFDIFDALRAHNEESIVEFIPKFVAILESSKNKKLCLRAAKILNAIASTNKSAKKLLLTTKNIQIFVKLLNPSNILLALYGCRALFCYSTDEYIDDIVAAGAIPKFIKLLDAPNFGLIEFSLNNLQKICKYSAFGDEDAIEAGIIQALLKLLNPFNEILCLNALYIFEDLLNDGNGRHKKSIAKSDVILTLFNLILATNALRGSYTIPSKDREIMGCAFNVFKKLAEINFEIFVKEIEFERLLNFVDSIEKDNYFKKSKLLMHRIYMVKRMFITHNNKNNNMY